MTRPQLLQVVDRLSSTRQALDVAKFKQELDVGSTKEAADVVKFKQELDVGSTKEAADMAKFKQALAVDRGSSRQQQADEVSSRLVGEGEDES